MKDKKLARSHYIENYPTYRVMLSFTLQIKLGDFGLATKVDYDGERKRTLCGTPNYIAPEVLTKKGKCNAKIT